MTIGLISVKKMFPVVNRLQRSKPEKSRNIKDDLNYLSEKKPILLFHLITSLLLIGPSISGSDNCTLHCYKKNLTRSTDFTAFLIKNINCTKSSSTKWFKSYHPSYNTSSNSSESYEKIINTKACDKVNTPGSSIMKICNCLRAGKNLAVSFVLHFL